VRPPDEDEEFDEEFFLPGVVVAETGVVGLVFSLPTLERISVECLRSSEAVTAKSRLRWPLFIRFVQVVERVGPAGACRSPLLPLCVLWR